MSTFLLTNKADLAQEGVAGPQPAPHPLFLEFCSACAEKDRPSSATSGVVVFASSPSFRLVGANLGALSGGSSYV